MYQLINDLLYYALDKKLIEKEDIPYSYNQVLSFLKLEHMDIDYTRSNNFNLEKTLEDLIIDMHKRGVIESSTPQIIDLLSSKIMNIFSMRPSCFIKEFNNKLNKNNRSATKWFYNYMQNIDYIKTSRIKKNISYKVLSQYGNIEITINLSKPEKDPKDIARAAEVKDLSNYPVCVLCKENEGFSGNLKRDSRDSIRLIPTTINKSIWYLQYSPYSYYNEHAILLSNVHSNMIIDRDCFINLLSAVDKFDNYFFGSNSDIPIVGGSILSHNHYQGGVYSFPIEKAKSFYTNNIKNIKLELLHWPLSTIRLTSTSKNKLVDISDYILNKWINYSNIDLNIINYTNNIRHNAITPIVRKIKNKYQVDLVLRNNLTTTKYPLGIYHPHSDVWPIKKENIGLIEVMGLAILPKRLLKDLDDISKNINDRTLINKDYLSFYDEIITDYKGSNPYKFVLKKAGLKFVKGLTDCGVFYNRDSHFIKFIEDEVLKYDK